jgi:hypothetical protein
MRLMFDCDVCREYNEHGWCWRGRVTAWRGYYSRGWPHWTARTYPSADTALAAAERLARWLRKHPESIRSR